MTRPARTLHEYNPDYAVAPGETIREQLDCMSMTQKELAHKMKRPIEQICRLVNGSIGLTVETALQLESALGLPARFWMNLEVDYRLHIARARRLPVRRSNVKGKK